MGLSLRARPTLRFNWCNNFIQPKISFAFFSFRFYLLFSHTVQSYSPSPLTTPGPNLPLPDLHLLHFPSQKNMFLRDMNCIEITRCNKTRQKTSYQGWTVQLSRKKRVPWPGKKNQGQPIPTVRSPTIKLRNTTTSYMQKI